MSAFFEEYPWTNCVHLYMYIHAWPEEYSPPLFLSLPKYVQGRFLMTSYISETLDFNLDRCVVWWNIFCQGLSDVYLSTTWWIFGICVRHHMTYLLLEKWYSATLCQHGTSVRGRTDQYVCLWNMVYSWKLQMRPLGWGSDLMFVVVVKQKYFINLATMILQWFYISK